MGESSPSAVELGELLALFYIDSEALGEFSPADTQSCPHPYRELLCHNSHMTVTVERHHGCPVDVSVLADDRDETHYVRKILLKRTNDGQVVQFGIVRLALAALAPNVRDEIMAKQIPLGRVLIQHDVMRQVQLNAVWQVTCGPELAEIFGCPIQHRTYGRTALIYCDGEPAVELLEIVAPEDNLACN